MNNLIINGIDHSKFDLEWAKRCGVLAIVDSTSDKIRNLGVYVRGNENVKPYIRSLQAGGIAPAEYGYAAFLDLCIGKSATTIFGEHIHLRMATPSECAEAGIEYIGPPARWFPIESAPKDGTKVVLLTPTGDMLSPCEFVEETAISETGAWLWWQVGPGWFTEVKNPTHYMILPKIPEENK